MGFFEMNTVIKIAVIVATWWIGSKIGTAWELVSKIHMYINVSKKRCQYTDCSLHRGKLLSSFRLHDALA